MSMSAPGAGSRSRSVVERRLSDVAGQLRDLRRELIIADEQLAHLVDVADEARIRSLVSETPLAEREQREAVRHAEAMRRHRSEVAAEVAQLEAAQDELLDRFLEDAEPAGP